VIEDTCTKALAIINSGIEILIHNLSPFGVSPNTSDKQFSACGDVAITQGNLLYCVAGGGFGFEKTLSGNQLQILQQHRFATDDVDIKIYFDDRHLVDPRDLLFPPFLDNMGIRRVILEPYTYVEFVNYLSIELQEFINYVLATAIENNIVNEEGSKTSASFTAGYVSLATNILDMSVISLSREPSFLVKKEGYGKAVSNREVGINPISGKEWSWQEDYCRSEVVRMFLLCHLLLHVFVPKGYGMVRKGTNFKRLPKLPKIIIRVMVLMNMPINEDVVNKLAIPVIKEQQRREIRDKDNKIVGYYDVTVYTYPHLVDLCMDIVVALTTSKNMDIKRYVDQTIKAYKIPQHIFTNPSCIRNHLLSNFNRSKKRKRDLPNRGGGDEEESSEDCRFDSIGGIDIDDLDEDIFLQTGIAVPHSDDDPEDDHEGQTGGGGSTGSLVTIVACMATLFFATVMGTVRR
jgi:hypothetical protein